MNERTRIGLEILLAASAVGLLGNLLLRETPWGANVFFFVAAFAAATVVLIRRHRPEMLTVRTISLIGAIVFFGSMYVLRDAPELKAFDTIAMILLMGVLVLSNFGVNQRLAGIFHYAAGFVWSALNSLLAPFMLLGADIEWKSMPGNTVSKNIFSVLRGVAIALPLVMIFGALFMAADAAFENFANRAIYFDIDVAVSHVVLTSVFAWLTAGYFRGMLMEPFASRSIEYVSPIPKETNETKEAAGDNFVDRFTAESGTDVGGLPNNATVLEHINVSDPPNPASAVVDDAPSGQSRDWQNWDNTRFPQVFTLGKVETIIILGLVNVLFLSFVIFQLPYLFGGMDIVQSTPDFKLSDYARRGFGELVAVAALVLPILLGSHWLLRKDDARNETIFRVFAGIQIGLLFVIMVSAMQRLVLLTGEFGYGMTTVRFYPMVFMIWLAAIFVWFGWTVLRGGRNNFAWGALWAAIVVLGVTNLMNPHAYIARTNVQLMQQGRDFDASYYSELSDDAIPVLLEALPLMAQEDRCELGSSLLNRYSQLGQLTDIRSFNYGSKQAFDKLRANDQLLRQTEGCPAQYQNGQDQ